MLVKAADYASPDGAGIYPSYDRLALECALSRDTVKKHMKDFVENGILELVNDGRGGRGRANEYILVLDRVRDFYPVLNFGDLGRKGSRRVSPAPDASQNAGVTKGGATPPFPDEKGGQLAAERGALAGQRGGAIPPPTTKNSYELRRGSEKSELNASSGAPESAAATAPINTYWRSKEAKIISAVGRHAWETLLKLSTVEADDGANIVLSFPTKTLAEIVEDHHGRTIRVLLERRVEFICLQNHQRAGWLRERREGQGKTTAKQSSPQATAPPVAGAE